MLVGVLPAASLAGEPPAPSYQRPLDVVFIIDRSGSMDEVTPDPAAPIEPGVNNTRLGWANDAANNLVSALEAAGGVGVGGLHQVGLVTYGGGTATVDLALGASTGAQVHGAIDAWDGLAGSGNTPLAEGMNAAIGTMNAGGRTEVDGVAVLRVFILLSDGRPNPEPESRPTAEEIAAYLGAADQAFGIAIGATGGSDPGREPDLALMQAVSSPPANYSHVVDAVSLPNVFASIAEQLVFGDIQIQAGAAPGGPVEPDTEVTFTYLVWNNSEDTPLSEVSVTSACSPMSSPVMAGGNQDTYLEFGESWTYTCTMPLASTVADAFCAVGHFIGGGTDDDCAEQTVAVNMPATPTPAPTPPAAPVATPTPAPTLPAAPASPAPSAPSAPAAATAPTPSPSERPAEMASPAPTQTPPATTAGLQPPVPPVPPAPPTDGGSAPPPDARLPVDVVGGVLAAAAQQLATVVKPEAAIVVATVFSFPLALMAAVICFLVGQGRIDARDPKLRSAPRTPKDMVMSFRNEEEL